MFKTDPIYIDKGKQFRYIAQKTYEKTGKPDYDAMYNCFKLAIGIKEELGDLEYSVHLAKYIKEILMLPRQDDENLDDLLMQVFKFLARYELDSYLIYLEKDRLPEERFYLPKRKQLLKLGLIQALQDLEDDKLDILSISMPPGTQKTTLEKFFASWVAGRHPNDYSLFFTHSNELEKVFYEGVLDIITNSLEYRWSDIFPEVKFQNKSAEYHNLNLGKYKPFPTVQCTSIGSKNAGKVRCNRYLFCDDLIASIEEAINSEQLDKMWLKYTVDARQRKLTGCKELHIATRWSTRDVIGRLQDAYEGNERCKFIAVPDIDPVTGKSNFDYDYNGFTVEFFNDQALTMEEIAYRCLYKNEPIEREGLLYHENDLERYLTLPTEEPDAIIGICDTKDKGTDFMFMPCCLQYGNKYYLVDCICDDNTDYGVQYERLSNLIVQERMQMVEFEQNNGGGRVAYDVNKLVEEKGWFCNITTNQTESNKETKIIVNAPWVKKHVIFRDKSLYNRHDDYGKMMHWLLRYNTAGKNAHDDVPDGLACLALLANGGMKAHCTAMKRPW